MPRCCVLQDNQTGGWVVAEAAMAYGGVAAKAVRADQVRARCAGHGRSCVCVSCRGCSWCVWLFTQRGGGRQRGGLACTVCNLPRHVLIELCAA